MVDLKKKIAVFGGSFDPPTIAHIQSACEIYNLAKDIDEVWIVPCGDGRIDKKLKAKAYQRQEMLKLTRDDIEEGIPIEVN